MKKRKIVMLAMIAVFVLTACGSSEVYTSSPTATEHLNEFKGPTPTPEPPSVILNNQRVECKELEKAEIGDVVLFGKNELAWWVVEKGEDYVYLLSAYIVDHSTYMKETLEDWHIFVGAPIIFCYFNDREYREKFFSSSDMGKMLPTGDTYEGEDLYMTLPDVEEMVRWFPDLLVSDILDDSYSDESIYVDFPKVKEGAIASDIRLNPPVAPNVMVVLDEKDKYATNHWWMAEEKVSEDGTLYVPYWDGDKFSVCSRRIERYYDGPYAGVRPVIKVKIN